MTGYNGFIRVAVRTKFRPDAPWQEKVQRARISPTLIRSAFLRFDHHGNDRRAVKDRAWGNYAYRLLAYQPDGQSWVEVTGGRAAVEPA